MTYEKTNRRQFVLATAAAAPLFLGASNRRRAMILGRDEFEYEYLHDWCQLPDQYSWQTTHNVAVDSQNRLYVIHEGHADKKDHPSIFVFDDQGKFIRAFGQQFQGGGHGIEVRREGSDEFLYVAAYQQVKSFAKLTLTGETIWQKHAPMESGVYAEGEDTNPQKVWGRDRFMPTNFAFLDNGGFLLADGYGSFYIHQYDRDGNWVKKFGGPGDGNGKFNTPHGLWIDRRGDKPVVAVTDRAHNTLQILDLDGNHLKTIPGFGLPANFDIRDDLMLVPELLGRLSIVDRDYRVLARLGDDRARIEADKQFAIRRDPTQWQDRHFVHPHDACFDRDGNIFVAEWVATGRVSRLRKVS